MVVEDVEDLDFEKCLNALTVYRRDPKNKTWPKSSDVRAIVCPVMTPDAQANEAAARIREAIGKFGWPDPVGARKHIGELGWKVVERSGGWQYLCENHGSELNALTYHAQSRDLAKALIEAQNAGKLDQPISLGSTPKNALEGRGTSNSGLINVPASKWIQQTKKETKDE